MHCLLSQHRTVHVVKSIGLHRPNHVGRINVLYCACKFLLLHIGKDRISQPRANISKALVSSSIHTAISLDERVSTTFCNNNDTIAFALHDLSSMTKHFLKRNAHLRNEAKVYVPCSP